MITITPSRDMAAFNGLVNHPEIAPHVRDDSTIGDLDLSPYNTHANLFLLIKSDDLPVGFVIMLNRGCGVYEQHSGILKEHRGHSALRVGRDALRWMFLNTDCSTVSTWAWSSAKHVIMMARAVGFSEDTRTRWARTVNGAHVDRVVFSQTISDWARRAKDDFVEDAMKVNLAVEPHMLGVDAMFVRMALAGQYEKAQQFYNRIAAIFGANPIAVIAVRAGGFVIQTDNRILEIHSDLSISVTQPEHVCLSQPQSHT